VLRASCGPNSGKSAKIHQYRTGIFIGMCTKIQYSMIHAKEFDTLGDKAPKAVLVARLFVGFSINEADSFSAVSRAPESLLLGGVFNRNWSYK
jgi:hypothetical protein